VSLPLVLRPKARREFDEAYDWYETRQPGLGDEFTTEIRRVLNEIAADPKKYPVVWGTVREALADRFPYCIYYRVRKANIVVLSVFHTSRDPSIWKKRR
jgi:toxin ParE1/3/4